MKHYSRREELAGQRAEKQRLAPFMRALKARFPQLTAIEIRLAKRNPPFGGDIREAAVILQEKYS